MRRPRRIERKRIKGYRLPPNTVCVDRTSRYGNPFRVGSYIWVQNALLYVDNRLATELYRAYATLCVENGSLNLKRLKGKNCACFCPLTVPCHADVILELANR